MKQKLEGAAILACIVLGVGVLGGVSAWVGYIEGQRNLTPIKDAYDRCQASGGAWLEDSKGWRCGIKPEAGRW
jgi:hypothetical protein